MRWKRCLLIGLGLGLACVAASYVGTVRSYLAGEPFYGGRPASYWSRELARWQAGWVVGDDQDPSTVPASWGRNVPNWEFWLRGNLPLLARCLPAEPATLNGDPAALPVLLALVEDDDPKIRWAAVSGLGLLIKNPQAAAGVRKTLKDSDEKVRDEAKLILEARGEPRP